MISPDFRLAADRNPLARRTKEDEMAEARGHIIYFSYYVNGLKDAISRMKSDLATSEKSKVVWEERLAKMKEKEQQA